MVMSKHTGFPVRREGSPASESRALLWKGPMLQKVSHTESSRNMYRRQTKRTFFCATSVYNSFEKHLPAHNENQ
jgi:hypothetical protein